MNKTKISEYIRSLGITKEAFAKKLSIRGEYLHALLGGRKRASAHLAERIIRESEGELGLTDVYHDLHLLEQELRNKHP
jgi:hypothetical protein